MDDQVSKLPGELQLMIVEAAYGECTLRRHIIDKLCEQHLMNINLDDPIGQYQHGLQDAQIRRQALALMDQQERSMFLDMRTEVETLSLVNKDFRKYVFVAERNWLRKPPMDFKSFQDLCSNPRKRAYEDCEEIVLELFSRTDFTDPPQEMNDGNRVQHPITDHQRSKLRQRRLQFLGDVDQLELDKFMFLALLQLWTDEVERLPDKVGRVRLLCKKPFESMVLGPGSPGTKAAIHNLSLALRCVKGKDVFGGMLTEDTTN